jgi:hypothetical protein
MGTAVPFFKTDMGASALFGLCCKETVIYHLHSEMGASPPHLRHSGDRAIRLYLFYLRQKRIPLLSLVREKKKKDHIVQDPASAPELQSRAGMDMENFYRVLEILGRESLVTEDAYRIAD